MFTSVLFCYTNTWPSCVVMPVDLAALWEYTVVLVVYWLG